MKKNIIKVAFVAAFAIVATLACGESGNSDCNTYCTPDTNYDCIIIYGSGVEGVTCYDMRKR